MLTPHNPREYTIPINILLKEIIMQGSVNSKQYCKTCKKRKKKFKFTAEHMDEEGFTCPKHGTRPTRYYINAKAFKIGHLYSDPKTGKVFKNFSDALDVLIALNRAQKEGKLKKDDWIPEKVAEKRVAHLCRMWLREYDIELEKNMKSDTRVHHIHCACEGFIIPQLGHLDIRDIESDHVRLFYHHLLDCTYAPFPKHPEIQQRLSSRYIKDILDTLKALMIYANRVELPAFPFFAVVPAKEKQILGIARELVIVEQIPERHGYRLACLLLIRTGMHINEVIALKVHDMVDGILRVTKAINKGKLRLARKAGQPVSYRVTPELWQMLMEHIEGKNPDDHVFTIDGELIANGRLSKEWAKACKAAKVKHISLQQASRHSTATTIMNEHIQKGLQEVQKQLGHDNMQTGKKHYIVEG